MEISKFQPDVRILSLPAILAVHHCVSGRSAVAQAKQAIIIEFLPAFEAADQI